MIPIEDLYAFSALVDATFVVGFSIIQYGAPMSICHACHLASPLGPVKQWHVD